MVRGHLARPAWSSPAFVLAVAAFVVAMIAGVALVVAETAGAAKPETAGPKPLATFTVDRSGATPDNSYTFQVPNGVKQVRFELFGATGGGPSGGNGGKADATYLVSPGQVFQIVVGGAGDISTGGLNGGGNGSAPFSGGGGGASDVRVCADAAFKACGLTDRFVVAGGGGGDSGRQDSIPGGHGGGLTGGNAPFGGSGGTQTAGGAGDGPAAPGTFGFGGNADCCDGGGGGGGGWYGGGAGFDDAGGGGSGHISSPALTGTMTNGAWSGGDGKVSIYRA